MPSAMDSLIELEKELANIKNIIIEKINIIVRNDCSQTYPETFEEYKKIFENVMTVNLSLEKLRESIFGIIQSGKIVNSTLYNKYKRMYYLVMDFSNVMENLRIHIFEKIKAIRGYKSGCESYIDSKDYTKLNAIVEKIQQFEIVMTKFKGVMYHSQ
jgi:hypothetical protein